MSTPKTVSDGAVASKVCTSSPANASGVSASSLSKVISFTSLKIHKINKNMAWCNDVNHKKYNKLIKINKKIGYEKLFRNVENCSSLH